MRRLLSFLLALGGLLLLLGGAALAAYVGSDDTVVSEPASLGEAGQPVVTAPGLLAWDGLQITLRAQAPDGVFIGTAHPVDIEDLVGDSPHVLLLDVTPHGVTARELGSGDVVRPERADFWDMRQRGREVQELGLDRHNAGLQWVIAPLGDEGPTTLSFAVTLDGAWRASLVVAGAGAVLLLLGAELFLWVGRRKRRRSAPPSADEPPRPAGRRKAPRGRRAASRRRMAARVATVVALAVVASGCGATLPLPVKRQAEDVARTKVALTLEETAQLYGSWDRRHNAVLESLREEPRRAPAWERVERGAALEADVFGTRYLRTTSGRLPRAQQHVAEVVYAPRLDAYPMWALVAARQLGTDGKDLDVQLFRRDSVASPWILEASALVPARTLPDAGRPARLPDDAVRDAAAGARDAWASWLASGKPDTVEVDEVSRSWRAGLAELAGSPVLDRVTATSAAYDRRLDVVAVDGGHLALATVRLGTTLRGRKAFQVGWARPWAALRVADRGTLRYAHLATGLLFLPDKGEPRILGSTFREVAARR